MAHVLIELVPTAAPVQAGPGRYALVVGGARVEFGDDVWVTTLRRITGIESGFTMFGKQCILEALRSC